MFDHFNEFLDALAELAWAEPGEPADDELFEAVIALARVRPIVERMSERLQTHAQARAPAARAV